MAYAKAIVLSGGDIEYLQLVTCQRTIQAQIVDCAKILLYKEQGDSNNDSAIHRTRMIKLGMFL